MSGAALMMAALLGAAASEDLPTVSPNLSNAELARQAEEAFRSGVAHRGTADAARPFFQQSANYFDELRRRGATNPILYRNLGNAQLLAGDLPAAILSFQRGLRLSPADLELRINLVKARDMVIYSSGSLGRQPIEQRPSWLPILSTSWLFNATVAFYFTAWVMLTRWLMARRPGRLILGIALLAAAGILTVFLLKDLKDDSGQRLIVVAEDGVLLRKGNGLAFAPRFEAPLNRGVEATLLLEKNGWVQIELAGGEVGWVPREFVLVDE